MGVASRTRVLALEPGILEPDMPAAGKNGAHSREDHITETIGPEMGHGVGVNRAWAYSASQQREADRKRLDWLMHRNRDQFVVVEAVHVNAF